MKNQEARPPRLKTQATTESDGLGFPKSSILLLYSRRRAATRQNLFDVLVRSRDHVHGDQFAHAPGRGGARIGRGLHRAHVSPYHDRDISRADIFLADQDDVCRLHHRVRGFNRSNQALGLDHPQCFVGHALLVSPGPRHPIDFPRCATGSAETSMASRVNQENAGGKGLGTTVEIEVREGDSDSVTWINVPARRWRYLRTPTLAAATALRVVFLTAYIASSARCSSSTLV